MPLCNVLCHFSTVQLTYCSTESNLCYRNNCQYLTGLQPHFKLSAHQHWATCPQLLLHYCLRHQHQCRRFKLMLESALSIYPSIHLSIHPSIYLSIYLSVCLSIYVIQVLLCHCGRQELADVERFFIRKLSPVFNIASALWNWEVVRLPRHVLGVEGLSDVLTMASLTFQSSLDSVDCRCDGGWGPNVGDAAGTFGTCNESCGRPPALRFRATFCVR